MSITYKILKSLVKMMGIKKKFEGNDKEAILEKKRKLNERTKTPNLKDKDFDISLKDIMGFQAFLMIHKMKSTQACLFLIGTGMTGKPGKGAIKNALKMAKETGMDLYVPYYPLCTDYPLTRAYQMIQENYKEMLESYDASKITVFGYSSGGNLALGMASYINKNHLEVPLPSHIVAVSPGNCLETEEEWQRLLELDKKDVVTPASFIKIAEEIMRHGDDAVPDYMLWLQKGDYSGVGKITIIYGTDEVLYAFYDVITSAVRKYVPDTSLIVGEGMYHCYPVLAFCPEAKKGHKDLINLLKVK